MNINDYIYYYGEYTFKEKPFNEIDNVIFSLISYVDFNGILSKNKQNKLTLENASNIYFLNTSYYLLFVATVNHYKNCNS